MDDTYQNYVNRVAPMTLPTTHQTQLQNIQKSPKFDGTRAVPFPGYSIVTPTWEDDRENYDFYTCLKSCQEELLRQLNSGVIIPVPPETFHVTIADLVWDNRYQDALAVNPEFDHQLKTRIAQSFQQYRQSLDIRAPIASQLLGISVFPRAIAVCLVPKNETDYQRIVALRRSIYQNPGIIALGIEQQYNFTAHITLGYFGDLAPNFEPKPLLTALAELNDRWLENPAPDLKIIQAQLRKFEDMITYNREPDWPVVEF